MEGKFYYKKKQPKELQPTLPEDLVKQKKEKKIEDKLNDNKEANNVLIIEQLSTMISDQMLIELFSQYPGYTLLRLVAPRGLAFVEYENDD